MLEALTKKGDKLILKDYTYDTLNDIRAELNNREFKIDVRPRTLTVTRLLTARRDYVRECDRLKPGETVSFSSSKEEYLRIKGSLDSHKFIVTRKRVGRLITVARCFDIPTDEYYQQCLALMFGQSRVVLDYHKEMLAVVDKIARELNQTWRVEGNVATKTRDKYGR